MKTIQVHYSSEKRLFLFFTVDLINPDFTHPVNPQKTFLQCVTLAKELYKLEDDFELIDHMTGELIYHKLLAPLP